MWCENSACRSCIGMESHKGLDQHHQMTVLGLHLIHKGWCICTSVGDGRDQPALRRRIVQQVSQRDALRLVDNRLGELVATPAQASVSLTMNRYEALTV